MSSYQKNMISSLVFFVLGIVLLIVIPTSVDSGTMSDVGPRAFPYFIAVCMIALSSVLAANTYWERKKNLNQVAGKKAEPGEGKNELRALALVAIILLYILTFDILGYFVSTFIASTLMLLLFRTKNIKHYLIVYGVAIAIYLAFTKLLFVMLP
ncbi:MAG: tripartite tricarboxylate transporter TctB family protein [Angelakisella sp.]